MSTSEKHPEDLIKFLSALQDGQDIPQSPGLDPADAALMKSLVSLARTIKPDSSFTRELREHLLHVNVTEQRLIAHPFLHFVNELMTAWRNIMARRKRFAYAIGLGALLALVAVPALAWFALEHFAPREVEKLPIAGESVALATLPPEDYSENLETLEKQAGFSPLMPRYVPSGCNFHRGYYLAEPIGEIHLEYDSFGNLPCLDISQRETEGDRIDRPFVGEDSMEEITINGKPALYINGTWLVKDFPIERRTTIHLSPKEQEELFDGAVWVQGPQQLIFEQNGLLIRIDAGPKISKEELVKIAESME